MAEQAALCKPDAVHLCTGSDAEDAALKRELVLRGSLVPLAWPGCFLARSPPEDVARVESRTFICSEHQGDAGPTNHWAEPVAMKAKLRGLFDGAMAGRTLYAVPYCMGPLNSPLSAVGVQLTDSPYAVLNARVMTRMGKGALAMLGADGTFVQCMHTVGAPLARGQQDHTWPQNADKYITHFPEARQIWSYGSGYGGNALTFKKSYALRIASVLARDEGWLAEHMLIAGVTSPAGVKRYIAAALPSACGKTNLAMLRSALPGWRVETVGDDIAWMRWGKDGRLVRARPAGGPRARARAPTTPPPLCGTALACHLPQQLRAAARPPASSAPDCSTPSTPSAASSASRRARPRRPTPTRSPRRAPTPSSPTWPWTPRRATRGGRG